jgi:hypothetical protein
VIAHVGSVKREGMDDGHHGAGPSVINIHASSAGLAGQRLLNVEH